MTEELNVSQSPMEKSDINNNQPVVSVQEFKREYTDRGDILSRLEDLKELPVDEIKEEIDFLKQLYYKLRKSEIEASKDAFQIQDGSEEQGFVAVSDDLEDQLKVLLNEFKLRKAALQEERENIKRDNLQKKNEILEKLKSIVADSDSINKHYSDFIELQQSFKEINDVPASNVSELWKQFQAVTETFYDLLKINKELRDYDFKKNLDKKEALIAEAELLVEKEDDIVASFKKLQDLHDEWRKTGPVSSSVREELWTKFKNLSSIINKRHQQFFEVLKETESANELAKTAICETIESFNLAEISSFQQWEDKTKEVIALQEDWKKLGFAPKKTNNKIFERFRKACDSFFKEKADYYRNAKDVMVQNLEKKKALCEKAESLKDSTDWRHTTDVLVALQKEWKTIGSVPRKYSDAIWARFIEACDSFFANKEKNMASSKSVETENLAKKKSIIAELKKLAESDSADQKIVKDFISQWNGIGHVPFKEKDKIYKEYQALLDKLFKRFNAHGTKRNLDTFAANVDKLDSKHALFQEREKLNRAYERISNEVKTYNNNLGFLSLSSKSGNSLVKEIERKVEKLKEDLVVIASKIKMIEDKLK